MSKTIETTLFKKRFADAVIAVLCAVMLAAIGIMHLKNTATPVTIPSAIKMEWAADSTWTGGWR